MRRRPGYVLAALAFFVIGMGGCASTSTPASTPTSRPPSYSPSPSIMPVLTSTPITGSSTTSIPPTSNTITATKSSCRPGDPTANVYHPYRLRVIKSCMTVSGTVASLRAEADGDTHFDLALDAPYISLLAPANYSAQHGDLVVEIVPADKPGCTPGQPARPASGTYNYGVCTGADETTPSIGTHVWITGPYVLDLDHGGWAEIHPAWAITLSSGTPTGTGTGTGTTSASPTNPPISALTTSSEALKIVSVTSSVLAGADASLSAITSPYATCSLSVTLPSGAESQSQGLGSATADSSGTLQWSWQTGWRTDPGTATATVTCGSEAASTTFQITS